VVQLGPRLERVERGVRHGERDPASPKRFAGQARPSRHASARQALPSRGAPLTWGEGGMAEIAGSNPAMGAYSYCMSGSYAESASL
jgi:hypothetical protein